MSSAQFAEGRRTQRSKTPGRRNLLLRRSILAGRRFPLVTIGLDGAKKRAAADVPDLSWECTSERGTCSASCALAASRK